MTGDFDRVHGAFDTSAAGHAWSVAGSAIAAAWNGSAAGHAMRSAAAGVRATPAPERVRTVAVVLAIASGLQPLLIGMMPRTVAPAIPAAAFIVGAVFAAAVAWQAEAIVIAWPSSRLARLIR